VYFVSKETRKRQHNDKEWKFKEQHAKMWENIAGASAPSPRRCDASVAASMQRT